MNSSVVAYTFCIVFLNILNLTETGQCAEKKLVTIESTTVDGRLTVTEVSRFKKTSLLQTDADRKRALEYGMHIMRACYEIAKARHMRFFLKLSEREISESVRTFTIGFTNDKEFDIEREFGVGSIHRESVHVFDVDDLKDLFE